MTKLQSIKSNESPVNYSDQAPVIEGLVLSPHSGNSVTIINSALRVPSQITTSPSGIFSGSNARGILAGKKGKKSPDKTEPEMSISSRAASPAEIKRALVSKEGPITLKEIEPHHRAGGILEKTPTLSFRLDGQTTTVKANTGLFRTKDRELIAIIKRRGIEGYKAISKPIAGMTYFVPENNAQEIEDALSGKKREQADESLIGDYLGSL